MAKKHWIYAKGNLMATMGANITGVNVGSINVAMMLDASRYISRLQDVQKTTNNFSSNTANAFNKVAAGAQKAQKDAGGFADSIAGSLNKIATTAAGVLVRDAVRAVKNFALDIVGDAFDAYAAYERMQQSLESLIKVQVDFNTTVTKSRVVGQEVYQLSAAQSVKLQQMKLDYEQLGLKIKEATLHHSDLVAKYGEEGLATQRVASEIKEMELKYNNLGASIAKMGSGVGTVVPILEKYKESTMDSAEAEAFAAKEAQNLMKYVQNLAIFSPYTEEDVQNVLQTASSYGFLSDAVADLSVKSGKMTQQQRDGIVTIEKLTSRVIDWGSAAGRTGNQMYLVVKALSDVKTKGVLRGEEARQMGNLIPLYAILSEKLGKTQNEIIELQRAGKISAEEVIGSVTEWMGKFEGAAKNMAFTWYGLKSTVEELKNVVLRSLFGGILKAIQPYVQALVEKIADPDFLQNMVDLGNKLGDAFKTFIDTMIVVVDLLKKGQIKNAIAALGLSEESSKIIEKIVNFCIRFSTLLKNDINTAVGAANAALKVFFGIMSLGSTDTSNLADAVHTLFLALVVLPAAFDAIKIAAGFITNPFNLITAAIVALVLAFNNNFLGIKDKLQSFFDWLGSFNKLGQFFKNISSTIEVLTKIQASAHPLDFWQELKVIALTMSTGLFSEETRLKINDIIDKLKAFYSTVNNIITLFKAREFTAGVVNIIKMFGFDDEQATSIVNTLRTIYDKIMDLVRIGQNEGIKGILSLLGIDTDKIKSAWNTISQFFGPAIDRLVAAFDKFLPSLSPIGPALKSFGDALLGLANAVGKLYDVLIVKTGVQDLIIGAIGGLIDYIINLAAEWVKNGGEMIAHTISAIAAVIQTLADLIDNLAVIASDITSGNLSNLGADIGKLFTDLLTSLKTAATEELASASLFFSNIVAALRQTITDALNFASADPGAARYGADEARTQSPIAAWFASILPTMDQLTAALRAKDFGSTVSAVLGKEITSSIKVNKSDEVKVEDAINKLVDGILSGNLQAYLDNPKNVEIIAKSTEGGFRSFLFSVIKGIFSDKKISGLSGKEKDDLGIKDSDMSGVLAEIIIQLIDSIAKDIDKTLASIKSKTDETAKKIYEAVIGAIISAIDNLPTTLATSGGTEQGEAAGKFAVGALNIGIKIVSWIIESIYGYLSTLYGGDSDLSRAVEKLVLGIIQSIKDTLAKPVDIGGIGDAVAEWFAKDMANFLADRARKEKIDNAIGMFWYNFWVAFFKEFKIDPQLQELDKKGKELIDGIIAGFANVPEMIKNLEAAITKFIEDAIDSLFRSPTPPSTTLEPVGGKLIDGLMKGISDKGKWFYDQFVDWLKTWVPAAVLKAMGIASPSRYFMWVGRMIVAGLAEGIKGATPEAVQATTEMINSVIGVLNSLLQFLDSINKFVAIEGLEEKVSILMRHLQVIINHMLPILATYRDIGKDKIDAIEVVSSIVGAVSSAVSAIDSISKSVLPDNIRDKVVLMFTAIQMLINQFLVIAGMFTRQDREELKRISEELGIVFSAFSDALSILGEALDIISKIDMAIVPDISGKLPWLLSVVRNLVVSLGELFDDIGRDLLAKAAAVAEILSKIIAPWVQVLDAIDKIFSFIPTNVGDKLVDIQIAIGQFIDALMNFAPQFDSEDLKKASEIADFVSKIISPWSAIVEAIQKISEIQLSGIITNRSAWPALDYLVQRIQVIINAFVGVYNSITQEDMAKARSAAEVVAAIVAPFSAIVEAIQKIVDFKDADISSNVQALVLRVKELITAAVSEFSAIDPNDLLLLKRAFELISPVITAFASVVDLFDKMLAMTNVGIFTSVRAVVISAAQLISELVAQIRSLNADDLKAAAAVSGYVSAIIEPWKIATEIVASLSDILSIQSTSVIRSISGIILVLIDEMKRIAEQANDETTVKAMESVSKIISPWKGIIEAISSINETFRLPTASAINGISNVVTILIAKMKELAALIGVNEVDIIDRGSAAIEKITNAWKNIADAIKAIQDVKIISIGATVSKLVDQVLMLIVRMGNVISYFTPQEMKTIAAFAELVSKALAPWKDAVETVTSIGNYAQVGPIGDKVDKLISQIIMLIARMGNVVGYFTPQRLSVIAMFAKLVTDALSPWKLAVETVDAIGAHKTVAVGDKANKLTDQIVFLITKLEDISGRFTQDRLEKIAATAGFVTTALSPWTAAVDAIKAISEHATATIGPAAQKITDQILFLISKMRDIYNFFGEKKLDEIAKAAGFIVTALTPWVSAVEAIASIANHMNKVIGPVAETIKNQVIGLIVKLRQIVSSIGPDALKAASEAGQMVVAALDIWEKAIAAIEAISKHTDAVIGPIAERIKGQIISLVQKLNEIRVRFGDKLLAEMGTAAGFVIQALSVWETAIKVIDAISLHTDVVIGPIAERLKGQIIGLVQKIIYIKNYLGLKGLEEAAAAADMLVKIMAPWEAAVAAINSIRLWKDIKNTEQKFGRFIALWINIIDDIAKMVRTLATDALPLAARFAEILGTLADGLKSAVELVMMLPDTWDVGETWTHFTNWVKDVFLDFYNWVNQTSYITVGGVRIQVPLFSQAGMNAMSLFATTLESLMSALKLALELAVALAADWTDPPSWNDFAAWVQSVFINFYEWVEISFSADSLALMSTFSTALNDLMSGLQVALELAMALPTTGWDEPPSWAPFRDWVQAVFVNFYDWIENRFTEDQLLLVGNFASALSDLMGGLKDALDVALALVESWDPPQWTDFAIWVQDVFQNFHDWLGTRFTTDQLALVGAFGDALSSLMGGLKDALAVATALPAQWEVPDSWVPFMNWVKDVFQQFVDWLTGWGTQNPVPIFNDEELDLVGKFADALSALFGGLKDALDFAMTLPETWTEPVSWAPFLNWVKDAFLVFYNWVVVSGFTQEKLLLVGAFGTALTSLMNALKAALDLALALPISWTDPIVWTPFFNWVTAAFMQVIDWIDLNFSDEEGSLKFQVVNTFGQALQSLFNGLSAALTLFEDLIYWTTPNGSTFQDLIDTFLGHVYYTITSIVTYTQANLTPTIIAIIGSFGSAMSSIVSALSSALDLFRTLADPGNAGTYTADEQFQIRMAALMEAIYGTFHAFNLLIDDHLRPEWIPDMGEFLSGMTAVFNLLTTALNLFISLHENGLPDPEEIEAFIAAILYLFRRLREGMQEDANIMADPNTGVLAGIQGALEEFPNSVNNPASQQNFNNAGGNLISSLAGGFDSPEAMAVALASANYMASSVRDAILGYQAAMHTSGYNLVNSLSSGMRSNESNTSINVGTTYVTSTIGTNFSNASGSMWSAGLGFVNGIKSGMMSTESGNAILNGTAFVNTSINTAFTTTYLLGQMWGAGYEFVNSGLRAGMMSTQAYNALLNGSSWVNAQITNTWWSNGVMGTMYQAGQGFVNTVSSGLQDTGALGWLYTVAYNLGVSILGGLMDGLYSAPGGGGGGGLRPNGFMAGESLVEGIAAGMRNGVDTLTNSMDYVLNAIDMGHRNIWDNGLEISTRKEILVKVEIDGDHLPQAALEQIKQELIYTVQLNG